MQSCKEGPWHLLQTLPSACRPCMYKARMLTQRGAVQIVEEGSGWVQALPAGLQALGCRLLDAQQLGSSLPEVTLTLLWWYGLVLQSSQPHHVRLETGWLQMHDALKLIICGFLCLHSRACSDIGNQSLRSRTEGRTCW